MYNMSKNSFLILLGALVVLTTFLGIPGSWKTIVFSVLGLLIIVTASLLRKDIVSGAVCTHLTEEKQTDSYRQSGALRHHDPHEHEESATESRE